MIQYIFNIRSFRTQFPLSNTNVILDRRKILKTYCWNTPQIIFFFQIETNYTILPKNFFSKMKVCANKIFSNIFIFGLTVWLGKIYLINLLLGWWLFTTWIFRVRRKILPQVHQKYSWETINIQVDIVEQLELYII